MQVTSLTIEGFGSFQQSVTIPFAEFTLGAIQGPIGAGKSTLFDAIGWALYGSSRSGVDSVVNDLSDSATVRIEVIQADGSELSVTRTRQRDRRSSVVLESLRNAEWEVVATTQKDVTQILGCSAELFRGTTYAVQGDAGRFCQSEPSERRRLLSEMLGLEQYGQWRKDAVEERSDARELVAAGSARIQLLQEQIVTLQEQIETNASGQTELAGIDSQVEASAQSIAANQAEYAALVATAELAEKTTAHLGSLEAAHTRGVGDAERSVRQALAGCVAAEANLERSNNQASAIDCAQQSLTELEKRQTSLESDLARCEERGAELQDLIEDKGTELAKQHSLMTQRVDSRCELVERLRLLTSHDSEDRCWVCSSSLNEEGLTKLVEDLNNSMGEADAAIEAIEERISQASDAAAEARNKLGGEQETRRSLRGSQTDVARAMAKAEQVIAGADSNTQEQCDATEAVRSAKQNHKDCVTQQEAAAAPSQALIEARRQAQIRSEPGHDAEALGERIASMGSGHERLLHYQKTLNELVATQSLQTSQLNDLNNNFDAWTQDHDQACETMRLWAKAVDMLGPSGLPAMLIADAIPELEAVANDLLLRLTSGQHRLEFRTSRVTKSGTNVDTLDLVVHANGTERDYRSCSGGERRRIDTATRIALSRLLARNAGMDAGLLMLDEALDLFDPVSGRIVIDALSELIDDGLFSQVLVVTHQSKLAEQLPQRIHVEPSGSGSTLRWET